MTHPLLLLLAETPDPTPSPGVVESSAAAVVEALAHLVQAASNNPYGIVALALVGVAVWLYAIRGAREGRQSPRGTWPMHALGLVAILALTGAAMQMYFRGADIDARKAEITELQEQLKKAQERLAKPYDVTFKLLFPAGQPRNPFDSRVEVWLKRHDELEAHLLRPDRFQEFRGAGGINVEVPELGPGDKVRVQLYEQHGNWRSDDVRLPEAQLRMNPSS